MRQSLTTVAVFFLMLTLAVPASHAGSSTSVQALVVDSTPTGVGQIPAGHDISPLGVGWHTASGRWHAREVPVIDTLVDPADASAVIGSMTRHVSFNLDPATGASTAWCDFSLSLDGIGTFDGRCNGSLLVGRLHGHDGSSGVSGVYRLAPGGTPALGPYELDLVITTR